MKKKIKDTVKIIAICLICGAFFVLSGYFYLNDKIKPAENHTESVPYSAEVPENTGVLLDISGNRTLFYFNFEDRTLSAVLIGENEKDNDNYFGYPVNFTVKGDYGLVAGIIDRIGGIELTENGETLRLTGVQVADMLTRTVDDGSLKREVISAAFSQIAKSGFERDCFVYIIENSKTDITVPDCYRWHEYMSELCRSGGIVN